MNLAASIFAALVWVIGGAIVTAACVLLAILVALHTYEAGTAMWRRLMRWQDSTLDWWP